MNIKFRFALLFTLFAAIILFISSTIIFLLYKNYRYEDFFNRLENQVMSLNEKYVETKASNNLNYLFTVEHKSVLSQEQKLMIAEDGTVMLALPIEPKLLVTTELLSKIKSIENFRFIQNNKQCIGIYFKTSKVYIIISAFDSTGLRKEKNLLYIMSFVYIGALMLTAFFAFLFVQQAFKPLVRLSKQMQQTTALNMTERVDETNVSDEIQLIAKNFNAMLDRLNQSFENQKSFVQHASHELRTPLATMLSQTESALNRNLSPSDFKYILTSLKEEQNNLIDLTNSLLLLSQYEKIAFSEDWPYLRIDELLYESVAAVSNFYSTSTIEILFQNTPLEESELLIFGNDALLKSAFNNLLKNAYLYSSNKKVLVTINTLTALEISFTNEGNQLSNEEVEKIFLPFFRGKNATFIKGYGIGLSIVNKVVEIHNGKMLYQRLGSKSNVFKIIFPLFKHN